MGRVPPRSVRKGTLATTGGRRPRVATRRRAAGARRARRRVRWSLTPAQPAGGRATPFPEVPADADLGAAWSPDGARIAFVAPGEAGLASRLHVLHLDGTPDRSAEVPLRVAGVSWSHDGRFLLARAAEPEGRDALFFFDTLDGSIGEIEFDRWVQLAVTRAGQR